MFKIKKDYLSSSKAMIMLSFGLILFLGILFLFIMNVKGKGFWDIGYDGVDRVVTIGTAFICFIPLFTFGCIFPTSEKTFSGKIKTNHLPFSNKQLAWKGIKLWLLTYPIWIIVATFIHLLYELKAINNSVITMATSFSMNSTMEVLLFNVVYIMIISVFILIVDMQIVASMIMVFAGKIKAFWLILIQILSNIIIVSASVFIINKLNIDTGINSIEGFIAVVILGTSLLIATIIYFVYSLKYIEKVYR